MPFSETAGLMQWVMPLQAMSLTVRAGKTL